jgi:hypothetical protein
MSLTATITGGAGKAHMQGRVFSGTYTGGSPTQLKVGSQVMTATVAADAFSWTIGYDSTSAATYGTPGTNSVYLVESGTPTLIDTISIVRASIPELIEQALMTTLGTVSGLSVERADTASNVPADMKAIVNRGILTEITEDEKADVPLMHDGYRQNFEILIYRAQADLETSAATSVADATIRNAIKAGWPSWTNAVTGHGFVQNLFWKPARPVSANQLPGVVIEFDALFYTVLNDLYTQ